VTIPDGTTVQPSQQFVKKWEVKNTGTCAWAPTFKVAFGYGNPMGGQSTAIGKTVASGESTIIEVTLTAPNTAGDASGVWRLQDDKGAFFGTNLTVVIKVVGQAKTATPTEEPTATTP
jgi:next-to-BRCA1 protein 1